MIFKFRQIHHTLMSRSWRSDARKRRRRVNLAVSELENRSLLSLAPATAFGYVDSLYENILGRAHPTRRVKLSG